MSEGPRSDQKSNKNASRAPYGNMHGKVMVHWMLFISKMCPSDFKMIPQIDKKYTLELPGPSWRSKDRPEVIQSPSKHLPDLKNDTKSYAMEDPAPGEGPAAGGEALKIYIYIYIYIYMYMYIYI